MTDVFVACRMRILTDKLGMICSRDLLSPDIMTVVKIDLQKQAPEVFCKKRYSYKFRKIHKKATVKESLF